MDFSPFAKNVFSQDGVDGILEALRPYARLKTFVEIGSGDGTICNTRYLSGFGWSGVRYDSEFENEYVTRFLATTESVARLGRERVGVLSIDIDFNTWHIWEACRLLADVVVIEYNGQCPRERDNVVVYDPSRRWDGTCYYGASWLATKRLGKRKGYTLVHADGVNAYFLLNELVDFEPRNDLFVPFPFNGYPLPPYECTWLNSAGGIDHVSTGRKS